MRLLPTRDSQPIRSPRAIARIAAALVVTLAGAALVAVAEDPPPPPLALKPVEAPRILHDGREFMPYLGVELLFVKKVCAPSREQFRAIKRDLRTLLMRAERGAIESSCDSFPQQIVECVTQHLSKGDAAKYRAEIGKRIAHERQGCVYTVVAILDDGLNLSEDQRNALVASLTANWKPGWSQIVEMAVRNGGNAIPALPDSRIVPALDREQIQKWRDLPKSNADGLRFDGLRIGSVGTPADESIEIGPDEGGP